MEARDICTGAKTYGVGKVSGRDSVTASALRLCESGPCYKERTKLDSFFINTDNNFTNT